MYICVYTVFSAICICRIRRLYFESMKIFCMYLLYVWPTAVEAHLYVNVCTSRTITAECTLLPLSEQKMNGTSVISSNSPNAEVLDPKR